MLQQSCVPSAVQAGGCRGLSDRECTCRCPIVDQVVGQCKLSTYPPQDLQSTFVLFLNLHPFSCIHLFICVLAKSGVDNWTIAIIFLVENLCGPVGGQQPKIPASCHVNSDATTTGGSSSSAVGNRTVVKSTGTETPGGDMSVPFTGQASLVELRATMLGAVVGSVVMAVFYL